MSDITLYRRSSSGPWWYDFYVSGERCRASCRTGDRALAEQRSRAAHIAAVAAARPTDPAQGARPTKAELASLASADRQRAESEGVTPAQLVSVDACWRHLTRLLGPTRSPALVDYDVVEHYICARRREGARGQSIRKEIQALRRGFRMAARWRWIAMPPELPIVRSDPPDQRRAGKLVPLDVLRRWLDALDTAPSGAAARAQAEIALRTGARAEEVRRLTWEWVEPGDGTPGVVALLRLPPTATKTRRERVVGLPAAALAILERARGSAGFDQPFLVGDHKKAFRAAAQAIGHTRRIHLRDLRHTHASWAAAETGNAAAAQLALGHSDLATTQRYLHATQAQAVAAAVAVDELLDGTNRHNPRSQVPWGMQESAASKWSGSQNAYRTWWLNPEGWPGERMLALEATFSLE